MKKLSIWLFSISVLLIGASFAAHSQATKKANAFCVTNNSGYPGKYVTVAAGGSRHYVNPSFCGSNPNVTLYIVIYPNGIDNPGGCFGYTIPLNANMVGLKGGAIGVSVGAQTATVEYYQNNIMPTYKNYSRQSNVGQFCPI